MSTGKILRAQELIIQAQIASDSAKGKPTVSLCKGGKQNALHYEWADHRGARLKSRNGREKAAADKYQHKDYAILSAIQLIAQSHDKTFRYSVTNALDQNGEPCYLVYFDFKIEGKRQQISFHCFNEELSRFVKKSAKSTWNKKNSMITAVRLDQKGASSR